MRGGCGLIPVSMACVDAMATTPKSVGTDSYPWTVVTIATRKPANTDLPLACVQGPNSDLLYASLHRLERVFKLFKIYIFISPALNFSDLLLLPHVFVAARRPANLSVVVSINTPLCLSIRHCFRFKPILEGNKREDG